MFITLLLAASAVAAPVSVDDMIATCRPEAAMFLEPGDYARIRDRRTLLALRRGFTTLQFQALEKICDAMLLSHLDGERKQLSKIEIRVLPERK
jgi:hypothetical protein